MSNFKPIIVITTLPNLASAELIGVLLLEKKLAACVQYENIVSQYMWEEKMCRDNEVRLSIKTSRHLYKETQKQIVQHHPYECPQVLMLPVSKGFAPYLRWFKRVLSA